MIREGVEAMKPRFEMLKEVRQRGLMIGIEFGAHALHVEAVAGEDLPLSLAAGEVDPFPGRAHSGDADDLVVPAPFGDDVHRG